MRPLSSWGTHILQYVLIKYPEMYSIFWFRYTGLENVAEISNLRILEIYRSQAKFLRKTSVLFSCTGTQEPMQKITVKNNC